MKIFSVIAIAFLLLTSETIQAQQVKMADLNFIAGKWRTVHAWGELEEIWSAPSGNNMIGSFRCTKDGKAVFYEFISIEQEKEAMPVMYLRHFGPGNIAWEEKNKPVKYLLEEITADKAVFVKEDKSGKMIYFRQSLIGLIVTLESKSKDGTISTDVFEFTRDFN